MAKNNQDKDSAPDTAAPTKETKAVKKAPAKKAAKKAAKKTAKKKSSRLVSYEKIISRFNKAAAKNVSAPTKVQDSAALVQKYLDSPTAPVPTKVQDAAVLVSVFLKGL